jgi:hypothetical protein
MLGGPLVTRADGRESVVRDAFSVGSVDDPTAAATVSGAREARGIRTDTTAAMTADSVAPITKR